jgi:hypothetical protein
VEGSKNLVRFANGTKRSKKSQALGMTKGRATLPFWCDGSNDNLTAVVHSSLYLPQAGRDARDLQFSQSATNPEEGVA